MPKNSPARLRANKKYSEKAYDQLTIRLPKGTKDRITNLGVSVNGFVSNAVLEKLNGLENE